MLEVLLESRGVRAPRPVGEAIISTAVHAAVVLSLLVAAHSVAKQIQGDKQAPEFVLPTDRGRPSPAQKLTYIAVGIGDAKFGSTSGAPKLEKQGEAALPQIGGSPQVEPDRPQAVAADPQTNDNAYSVLDVDSAAVRDPNSAAPAYPPVMMAKGVEGFAAMRFVVDSTGRIDLGTVELLQATHAEFVQAVREALPNMRFRPAKMGPTSVRQLAEQLFKFEIRRMASSTAEPGPKKP
jgi:TonB family protein